jgi:AbrB family looped-hinge helix DNA binding protein
MSQSTKALKIGKRGTFVIPIALRRRFGLMDGDHIILEDRAIGILIRPAKLVPRLTPADATELRADADAKHKGSATAPHRRARSR